MDIEENIYMFQLMFLILYLIYWSVCSSSRRGWIGGRINLGSFRFHFIKEHEKLVQNLSINISISCRDKGEIGLQMKLPPKVAGEVGSRLAVSKHQI